MTRGDTIAAIATAPGRGGVAVVRVSGPDAFAVAKRLTGREAKSGRVAFARLYEGCRGPSRAVEVEGSRELSRAVEADGSREPSRAIDEAVVLAFAAPRSYTGEDVVEFQCHGGSVTPRRVLEACFAAGARLARRGEFTERAFLNGKLDYDQAAAVLDLVDAKTVRAADAALEGLSGKSARDSRELYDAALSISTELEHALDVDEGELPDDFFASLNTQLSTLNSQLLSAIRRAREGKILRTGALVVLAGPPNAGKSSLMNALLEENRAIVSDVPGTTRDSIEEWLDLDGWPIRLVDTAGLRETGDRIEAEGVRRAEELMAKADVVVLLTTAAARTTAADGCRRLSTAIGVTSKCDLQRGEGLNVSAKTGEGLDELKREIVARLEAAAERSDGAADGDAQLPVLLEAQSLLADFQSPIVDSRVFDLVLAGNAVRTVAEKLGTLVGATYSSDLLDRLFSRFCVGK